MSNMDALDQLYEKIKAGRLRLADFRPAVADGSLQVFCFNKKYEYDLSPAEVLNLEGGLATDARERVFHVALSAISRNLAAESAPGAMAIARAVEESAATAIRVLVDKPDVPLEGLRSGIAGRFGDDS